VAAGYQAESNERRDLLISNFERRADLTRNRLSAVAEQLQKTEKLVTLGLATPEALQEARFKVAEAQAQVRMVELQIEEIRATGREPLQDISAPPVKGRDFVSERLRIELSVPEAALELARLESRKSENLLALGLANVIDVDAARARVVEMEVASEAFRTKLEIRQNFVSNKADAVETELRVLESDANQRQKMLSPKVALARKQLDRAKVNVQLGTAQRVDFAEASLRLQELEAEIAKADLDLALIRRRLAQHRGER
jgi:outer membrane protein TolC